MLTVLVKSGDVVDEAVDVLVSTANVKLALSGGVNGAILMRGGDGVAAELASFLKARGAHFVAPGTVVRTGPGPLAVKHILHAVAVTAFYESSVELVAAALREALTQAEALGARTLAVPALGTGYGPLSIDDFARAARDVLTARAWPFDELRVVLSKPESVEPVRRVLALPPRDPRPAYRLA